MIMWILSFLFFLIRVLRMSVVDDVHPYFPNTIADYSKHPASNCVFTRFSTSDLSKAYNLANQDKLSAKFLFCFNSSTLISARMVFNVYWFWLSFKSLKIWLKTVYVDIFDANTCLRMVRFDEMSFLNKRIVFSMSCPLSWLIKC